MTYLTGNLNGARNLSNPSFFEEIAQYISTYFSHSKKIVELGIGFSPWTALKLRQLLPETEIMVVDKNLEALKGLSSYRLRPLRDDLFKPRIEFYLGSSLLYSIHPPLELIEPIKKLAITVNAPLLVKPLSEDAYLYGFHDWKKIRITTSCILYAWNLAQKDSLELSFLS